MTQLRDLAKPFPSKFVKDNPSGYGSYVQHGLYKQRLLFYVGPYDFELVEILRGTVKGKDELGVVVVGAVMRLTVTIDGRVTKIEEVGDCEQPGNWPTDGARLKDAISDALKRCCPHIGLGLSLYNQGPGEFFLSAALREREESAGPEGGGEPSGQTLVAGNPAGESKDLTVPANLSPAPSEFCEACLAGDCQHCAEHDYDDQGGAPFFCDCPHDEGRPF